MSSILTGERLRVSVFGESHGPAIGAVADGLPSGEAADLAALAGFMARRAPGGALSTARREADAAEQLVREYGGLLNAVVRRHAPGLDADDILADALLAIWQNAGRFDGQHSFRAWAAAVARYRAIDAVRRLSENVGIPADLKEIVKPEDLDFLAQSAYDDACRPGNPRDTSVAEIKALYESLI